MTVERRIVVGLKDILSVVLACKKCGRRVAYSPDDKGIEIPQSCPCGHHWWSSDVLPPHDPQVFPDLLVLLRMARQVQEREQIGFRLLFEFEEPPR